MALQGGDRYKMSTPPSLHGIGLATGGEKGKGVATNVGRPGSQKQRDGTDGYVTYLIFTPFKEKQSGRRGETRVDKSQLRTKQRKIASKNRGAGRRVRCGGWGAET